MFKILINLRNCGLLFMFIVMFTLFIDSCNQTVDTNCTGIINGVIAYPGEGIPSNLVVGAIDTLTKKEYPTIKPEANKTDNNFHFTFKLPHGVYYVYVETDEVDTLHHVIRSKGYYTEYTRSGKYKSGGDASHKPIPVLVSCNDTLNNIIPGDFWK